MPSLAGEPTHWVHGTAFVEPDFKIHYLDIHPTKANGQTLILIHRFPQTSYEWRHVVQPFADRGCRVVCPDYRGAGDSSRPAGGYDKMTMSRDIYLLARDHLKLQRPIVLGHDIGSMVAVCYALQFEDSISALICTGECIGHGPRLKCAEAPQPGTKQYDLVTRDDEYTYALFYHFFFHAQPDIPELLTQGKEREYISSFYDRFVSPPSGSWLTTVLQRRLPH
jgi:pimeloyl-ACP methyl ester carboxylesterase